MDVLREVLLPKLEGVRKSGGSWMARCPAHEDGRASLHVSPGKDHPVVLKCHAGCQPEEILAAIGLTWDTLCTPRDEPVVRGEWTPAGPAIAVYDYTDENGKLLFQVCRTAGKEFRQRAPDSSRKSGWIWSIEGVRRVIYRLPKVLAAIADGEPIYICEGEKDVHAVEGVGAAATCNPGGAGKWLPEYADLFRGAIVVVVADRDKPGQAHARRVAASLDGIAQGVAIVEAAGEGAGGRELKDAADHIAAGHSLAEFVETWVSGDPGLADLAPDLHEFLAGVDAPYDWIIDNILERGDRLIWTGEEGLGKSVVGRQLAVGAAAGVHPFNLSLITPRRVLWIDCENSERQGRRHFRRLERATTAMGRRVPDGGMRLIHQPLGIDLTTDEDRAWLIERVHAHKPDLLYIGPLYRLHAKDMNDELAARALTRALDEARVRADCALIVEAHSPHSESSGSRPVRPIGSSLFRRWPELGYGISPATTDDPCMEVVVRAWRGARDERHWPRTLHWGSVHAGEFPWIDPAVANAFRHPQVVEAAT